MARRRRPAAPETEVLMPDPFITPLIAGAVAAALTSTTVKWSEIEAWIEGKRPGLKAPKGSATITWEKVGKKVVVEATVYSLIDPFLPGKPKPKLLGSNTWKADRLGPALESKFKGKQSFNVQLTCPSARA
jgi:hypothetical protein